MPAAHGVRESWRPRWRRGADPPAAAPGTAGGYDPDAIRQKLGNPWTFRVPGISIKPYPSGSLTHPAMTEIARLIRAHGIQAAQVESVEVGANRNMPNALIHHQPKTGLE